MDSQEEYTHQNEWSETFEEGALYIERKRITGATFQFNDGKLKAINMLAMPTGPFFADEPLRIEDWRKI